MHEKHRQFYSELSKLLESHQVSLVASDDDAPYGQHLPLIEVQFKSPYRCDEFTSIDAGDAKRKMTANEI